MLISVLCVEDFSLLVYNIRQGKSFRKIITKLCIRSSGTANEWRDIKDHEKKILFSKSSR